MGKAARENARQRELALIAKIAEFGAPASKREIAWVYDLLTRPRVVVDRTDDQALLRAGFKPNLCHRNCQRQEAAQKAEGARAVHGWWVQGPTLVCHSVMEFEGVWQCVTPQVQGMPTTFYFIEDPNLVIRSGGLGFEIKHIDGSDVPDTLRSHPEKHVEIGREFARLLAEGISAPSAFSRLEPRMNALMALSLPAVGTNTSRAAAPVAAPAVAPLVDGSGRAVSEAGPL